MKTQKLKAILMTLLMISLSSCQMPQLEAPIERCGPFIQKVDENLYQGKCRCHSYQIDEDFIGRISESQDYPLEYCSNSVVFRGDAWTELRTWFEDLFFWYEQGRKKLRRRGK